VVDLAGAQYTVGGGNYFELSCFGPDGVEGFGGQFWGLGDWRGVGECLRRGCDGGAAQGCGFGINFLDTADVYGHGRSERHIAQLKRERKEEIIVATQSRAEAGEADGRGL